VNHGTTEEIAKLPGIGPTLAQRIVEHRKANPGGFTSLDDLRQVTGIGKGKVAGLQTPSDQGDSQSGPDKKAPPPSADPNASPTDPTKKTPAQATDPANDPSKAKPLPAKKQTPAQQPQPPEESKTPPAPVKKTPLQILNTGTEEELRSLGGIGPALAKKIIAHREANPGGFESVADVQQIKGVAGKTVAALQKQQTANMNDVLNSGTVEEIARLPGMDRAKAEDAVRYREQRRKTHPEELPFTKVDDLKKVGSVDSGTVDSLAARQKIAMVDVEDAKEAQPLKEKFKKALAEAKDDPANAGRTDVDLMQAIVQNQIGGNTQFKLRGDPVPETTLRKHGALERVLNMWRLYNDDLLTPAAKQMLKDSFQIDSATAFSKAVSDGTIKFDQSWLDQGGLVSGKNAVGWWGVKSEKQSTTLAELVTNYGLTAEYYGGAAIRVTVSPEAARANDFRKPTAFDGMLFGEWARADKGNPLGVTSGGSLEAVAAGVPLKDCKIEVFEE